MPSQKTIPQVRSPQRKRGRERVAALLDAAALCFVEKGYDASTMTEIAARAEASIGSLYQFFPTKEVLAQALMAEHSKVLFARMDRLDSRAASWNSDELAARLIRLFVDFRRKHPSFAVLVEAHAAASAEQGPGIRQEVRDRLCSILHNHLPTHPLPSLRAPAMVVQQLMKAAVALQIESSTATRHAAQTQLRRALQLYLHDLARHASP
ncbi:TetR/AcrR family transcriptional regulator [Dyella silvatica]|uniref:TetR/AcrR family transcriptional regulator n=1 Tax=Dyella silvatica TaxID=2992128 RepID=UPI00225AE513|nr:TetR/AcrR family transcriptional regulator [Dyella silvatica]